MKNTFKCFVNCFLSVFLFFSLFLFPVFAEQPSTFGVSSGELVFTDVLTCDQFSYFLSNISEHVSGTICLKNDYLIMFFYPYKINDDVIYYNKYSSWDTRYNTFTTYNVSSETWRISDSILLFNDVGSITGSSSYSNWDSYNLSSFISSNNNSCGLFPSKACPVEVLNVLSNPNVLSLLNSYALGKSSIVDWNLYSITQSSGSTTLPICQSSEFDYLGSRIGYEIQVSTDGSTFTSYYSWTFYKDGYVGTSNGSACLWNKDYSWDLVSRSLIFSKSCYDSVINSLTGPIEVNDSKNNELLDSGNSNSQFVSNSINSTNDQLNSAVNSYDDVERELTDNFKVSVDAIDTNFSWGSGFLNSATFIRTCFDNLVEPEPIYNLLLFALILGFSLFIIGRLR